MLLMMIFPLTVKLKMLVMISMSLIQKIQLFKCHQIREGKEELVQELEYVDEAVEEAMEEAVEEAESKEGQLRELLMKMVTQSQRAMVIQTYPTKFLLLLQHVSQVFICHFQSCAIQ